MSESNQERTGLNALMAALAPEARIAAVDEPIMSARQSFEVPAIRIEGDEFVAILGRLYAHLAKGFSTVTAPADAYQSTAREIIDQCYPGGMRAARAVAVSGLNGGLPHVLDAFTQCVLNMRVESHFREQCDSLCPRHDYHARLAIVTQYLERYGEALFGTAVPEPEPLWSEFESVLRDHLSLMERNQLRRAAL